jgi:membrane-anchored protein YejM (alkaline phosphatase superfamily)
MTDAETAGLTPNLDRLAGQSLWLSNLYATGTRTVRGLESLTLSVPPTPGEAIVKRPDNGGLFSLGQLFAAHGYDSTFLYGGFGYFDNMNDFFGKNGFRIVDRAAMTAPEIAFANIWGVADESLYGRAMREADGDFARGQPFFQLVMTTSNHRPYSYPDGRIDIPSKSGREGAVKYTDWAIGDLLAKARQKPWFKDTLFVIVADHCAGSDGRTALPLNRYRIPLFVYSPAHVKPQRIERLVGQIDVAPTLLGLLHWNYDSRFFGKDILRMTDADERALLSNYQHLGLLDRQRLVVLSPGGKAGVQPAARPGPGAVPGRRAGISPAPWPVARNARQSGAPACRPPVKGACGWLCLYHPGSVPDSKAYRTHGFERYRSTFGSGPTTPPPPATRRPACRRGADPGAGGRRVLRRPLAAAAA